VVNGVGQVLIAEPFSPAQLITASDRAKTKREMTNFLVPGIPGIVITSTERFKAHFKTCLEQDSLSGGGPSQPHSLDYKALVENSMIREEKSRAIQSFVG
jgi:hypothetical protein